MGDDDAPWLRDAPSEPLQRDLEGLPSGWEDVTHLCPIPLLPGPVSRWICHWILPIIKPPKAGKARLLHGDGFLSRQGQHVGKNHVPLQFGVAHK